MTRLSQPVVRGTTPTPTLPLTGDGRVIKGESACPCAVPPHNHNPLPLSSCITPANRGKRPRQPRSGCGSVCALTASAPTSAAAPIGGPFIVDFFCADAGRCIEVDGDTHAEPGQPEYDAARAAWLGQLGSRVIRFTNADAFVNLAGVLETIRSACQEERAQETT